MPSAVATHSRAASAAPDDLDNLFNYDNDVNDFLKDLPLNNDAQDKNGAAAEPVKDIDEEIKIKKQRKPVPKLDEARLLSDAGIPRLRRITKSRLKFRGKGHEFSDISRLLNAYQLWLDDLYPRAKFKDAVQMVEKVGHSKRMQITRKAWLDDTKPHRRDTSPQRREDVEMSGALPNGAGERTTNAAEDGHDAIFAQPPPTVNDSNANLPESATNDVPDDDDLDNLLAGEAQFGHREATDPRSSRRGPFEEDEPDDDDLDALLAERDIESVSRDRPAGRIEQTQPADVNEFADEEEVLAGMDDMW